MKLSHRLTAIFGFLSAATVLVVFVAAAFLIRTALDHNRALQTNLRLAQVDRSRLLRLQIDEESGVRGYVDTHISSFLQPYRAGLIAFAPTAQSLTMRLRRLDLDASPVEQESSLNRQWLQTVARPLIRIATVDGIPLQVRGKVLVDQFRALDSQLLLRLNLAADRAEAATSRLVDQILAGAILLGVLAAVLLGWLSSTQQRLGNEIELQRLAYLEEKRIADALQEAFLVKRLPEVAQAELHAVYVPAGRESQVGGDWYDAFEVADGRILFSIGDVTGHGIEAAVVMSRVRQAMLSIGVDEPDPSIVLTRANEILLMQDATVVTAICGIIDLKQGVIRLANAGHPPAIVRFNDGELEKFGATGPPLGVMDHPTYGVSSVLVSTGSLLTLFTDGLIEYGRDWESGEQCVVGALSTLDPGTADPAAALLRQVLEGADPLDDVAILTVSFRESPENGERAQASEAARGRPSIGRSFPSLLVSAPPATGLG
ncbi:MAG TPA: SpoIIE family protein phosphatase [Verrucomicrobiae bacterium]|nr:SpoIIE family protein phosphatase [Verrucomicrobiae bacterium]